MVSASMLACVSEKIPYRIARAAPGSPKCSQVRAVLVRGVTLAPTPPASAPGAVGFVSWGRRHPLPASSASHIHRGDLTSSSASSLDPVGLASRCRRDGQRRPVPLDWREPRRAPARGCPAPPEDRREKARLSDCSAVAFRAGAPIAHFCRRAPGLARHAGRDRVPPADSVSSGLRAPRARRARSPLCGPLAPRVRPRRTGGPASGITAAAPVSPSARASSRHITPRSARRGRGRISPRPRPRPRDGQRERRAQADERPATRE